MDTIDLFLIDEEIFSMDKIRNLKKNISSIVLDNGVDYFEIQILEKSLEELNAGKELNSMDNLSKAFLSVKHFTSIITGFNPAFFTIDE